MVDPEDFFPDILPEVPGCPDGQVEQAVRDAAIRFCRDTMAWREEIDAFASEPGKLRYELGFDFFLMVSDAEIVALTDVSIKGESVQFKWDRRRLDLGADPKGESVSVFGALQPTRTAQRLPALLHSDYKEAIVAYALYRLLNQTRTEWAHPDMAQRQRELYLNYVREERISQGRGHSTAPTHVRPRRFV